MTSQITMEEHALRELAKLRDEILTMEIWREKAKQVLEHEFVQLNDERLVLVIKKHSAGLDDAQRLRLDDLTWRVDGIAAVLWPLAPVSPEVIAAVNDMQMRQPKTEKT